ncbi:hypothetical protein C8R43DRAFT_917120 [Mycena crocata]|nr:hypothetical protein C8R43DRAFT_917120 [Mycena crocata]
MSRARTRRCKYFLQGHCSHGDNCSYIHQVEFSGALRSPTDAQLQAPAVGTPRSDGKQQRSAHRPDPRPHPAGPSSNIANRPQGSQSVIPAHGAATSPQTRSRPKKGEIPCHAWKNGNCPKGAKCWYGHDPQVQEAERLRREHAARAAEQAEAIRTEQAALQAAELERQREAALARRAEQDAVQRVHQMELEARKVEIRRREAAHTIQRIVLGSSLVTFSAGISIKEVVAGFQSCRIQIKNLPRDATHGEIIELFTQQGVDPARLFIAGTKELADGHMEATLITTSEEGGAIAVGLEDIEFRQERLHFEVAENRRDGGMGNSAQNCDTLTMSWRAPSASAVVTFQSVTEAMAKMKVLNRQICSGRRVRVDMNQPPPGVPRGPSWQHAIRISGLPRLISLEAVQTFAGSLLVKFLKPISYDIDEALRRLKQDVEVAAGLGCTKSFDVVARDDIEGNMSVKASFFSWEVAKRVEESFVGKRLFYLANCFLRLRVPDPLQYILSVPIQQYQAQKRAWDSLTESANNKTAYIRVFPNQNTGKVQIKVLGEDKKAVGSLKVRVESLASGQLVASGEQLVASCWHKSFKSTTGTQFLHSLFTRTGAYARADWKLCVVKVYGDHNAVDRAREAVKAEVDRLNSLEWSVFLKKESIRFFVQRGIAALKESLGEDNATLNISPRVCKVVIKGGEEARCILNRLIEESLEEANSIPRGIQGETCPICSDEISHPVTLGCDHTYCMGCLRHYISTASDSFPLICLGNEATCRTPIPIPTIESFLPVPQYHQLLETAFLRYIEQHPREFKYCRTADCTQVYRSSTAGTAMTCPSCFLSICSSCDEEAHVGMSCADSRLQNDPGEQERRNEEWAVANGVKRCPTCSVWIEKIEGCNHMHCKLCDSHICWICLRVFPREQIYAHLEAAHGGAFIVPPEQPPVQNIVVQNNWNAAVRRNHVEELPNEPDRDRARLIPLQRAEDARRRQLEVNAYQYRQQEFAYQERVREQQQRDRQQAAATAAPRERESGWGCIVM